MRFLSPQNLIGLLLLVICLFSSFLDASFDLSTERPGQGALGMSLDYALAKQGPGLNKDPDVQGRMFPFTVFSSYITFKSEVTPEHITNGQLIKIALDAYDEMVNNAVDQYRARNALRDIPGVVTAVAFGNELILSSSQKGALSFTYDFGNNPVRRSLRTCIATTREHRTKGKCGEQLAAHLYYIAHPEGSPGHIPLHDRNARSITVGRRRGGIGTMEACGEDVSNDTEHGPLKPQNT